MTGVIISKKIVTLYWTRSIEDLKFKMRKVTVQLKKLLLKEGINRRKEDSYRPRVFSTVQESICDSKCVQSKVCSSVQKCIKQCNSVCLSTFSVILVRVRLTSCSSGS